MCEGDFGGTLGSLVAYDRGFVAILGSLGGHFLYLRAALGILWGHFGGTLGALAAYGGDSVATFGSLLGQFGVSSGTCG